MESWTGKAAMFLLGWSCSDWERGTGAAYGLSGTRWARWLCGRRGRAGVTGGEGGRAPLCLSFSNWHLHPRPRSVPPLAWGGGKMKSPPSENQLPQRQASRQQQPTNWKALQTPTAPPSPLGTFASPQVPACLLVSQDATGPACLLPHRDPRPSLLQLSQVPQHWLRYAPRLSSWAHLPPTPSPRPGERRARAGNGRSSDGNERLGWGWARGEGRGSPCAAPPGAQQGAAWVGSARRGRS